MLRTEDGWIGGIAWKSNAGNGWQWSEVEVAWACRSVWFSARPGTW